MFDVLSLFPIKNPKSSIGNRQSPPLPSIPILTVHQSKGLEFDTVIIAGLAEDEFPGYYNKRDPKLEEEKRLFYVALTRAKRHLILSSYQINDWGHEKPPSSFLTGLI